MLSYFPVFLSWHRLHRLCQLLSLHISCSFPRCGMIWSTTVAGVSLPCRLHSTQSGWAFMYSFESLLHLDVYPRSCADALLLSTECSEQYLSSVRLGQPGCRHGVFGLDGIIVISYWEGSCIFPIMGWITTPLIYCRGRGQNITISWITFLFFYDSHGRPAFPKCPYAETWL